MQNYHDSCAMTLSLMISAITSELALRLFAGLEGHSVNHEARRSFQGDHAALGPSLLKPSFLDLFTI